MTRKLLRGTGVVTTRTALAVILSLALSAEGHAATKAMAFADLSNTTYSGRSLTSKLGDVVSVRDYGAVGDNVADDCTAFTNALATGKSVYVPRTSAGVYRVNCQLSMASDGQDIVCEGHRTAINLFYSAGPQIVVGNGTTQHYDIGVRNCIINTKQPGQPTFFLRWVRGFRLIRVTAVADQLLKLGDSTLGTGKSAYIVQLRDSELTRTAGSSMHFVNVENFAGQWVADHVFYEGALTPGLDGWRCADNIQTRIDDIQWIQGYWSRDDINLDFTDCRVVNGKIDSLHSEGALNNAVRFEITSSTAKATGSLGFGGMSFIGGRYDAVNESFYVRNNLANTQMTQLTLQSVQQTGAHGTKGAVWIEGAAGTVDTVTLDGVNGPTSPASANVDWITIKGSDSLQRIDRVLIDNIGGYSSTGTPLRSQVRTEGAANGEVRAGYNVLTAGAGARFSDPSGVLAHP